MYLQSTCIIIKYLRSNSQIVVIIDERIWCNKFYIIYKTALLYILINHIVESYNDCNLYITIYISLMWNDLR